jgi:hypothetical protein
MLCLEAESVVRPANSGVKAGLAEGAILVEGNRHLPDRLWIGAGGSFLDEGLDLVTVRQSVA